MKKINLSPDWKMVGNGYEVTGTIPGSVYSCLLENGLADDPHFRDNEAFFLELMQHEYTFIKEFQWDIPKNGKRILLHCDGLDTLCEVYLNDIMIAATENMHRTYEFDVTDAINDGWNILAVKCLPIDPYIKAGHAKLALWDSTQAMAGISYIRKAYCMMGWDWGPMLPDAGIWRPIYFLVEDSARIADVRIVQRHEGGCVYLTPCVDIKGEAQISVALLSPDGARTALQANEETQLQHPQLWWPNGLGKQPLYTVEVSLCERGEIVDYCKKRVGIRTLKLVRTRDMYGESFYHEINGTPFFAMGGNYIPEDNLLSRVTPERSRKLLTQCRDCHFNTIRVWGGGYYPDDWFFDICDELGLVVFMDMMFACAMVPGHDAFIENISIEIEQNLRRIRHHACIAVLCGNNEIEEGVHYLKAYDETIQKNYIRVFEGVIPAIVKHICPELPYISSSPSTCGHMIAPGDENYGDCHYWRVWMDDLPFTEFRNHHFRYLSEFGFQSFPCEKTVNQFTLPEDRNIFSRIFEKHQRSGAANKKILMYLADTYLYPTDFAILLYASQILQAEAIRYGVEHFRRNRGRCMGTLYWQINDIWPGASWSGIDYYGRWKALQYAAKRFYAPVLLSCMETGEKDTRLFVNMEPDMYDYETKARLCITNDTAAAVIGKVKWALRNQSAAVIRAGETMVEVEAFGTKWLEEIDFKKTDVSHNYMSYVFEINGTIVSEGTVLFTAPKHYAFQDPHLRCEVNGDEITVFADCYARSVAIDSADSDFVLNDNYFDLNAGSRTVKVLEGTPRTIVLRSVYDIR